MRLQRHQIRHPQEARVDRSGRLDLESSFDPVPLYPQHVDELDRRSGVLVEADRELLHGESAESGPVNCSASVIPRHPDLEAHVPAELKKSVLDSRMGSRGFLLSSLAATL